MKKISVAIGIVAATAVPDFRNYICPDGLEGPGSVNIIGLSHR